ncbi:MAG: hypothetical protein ABJN40_13335 [Sneathiella sp.]
MTNPSPSAQTMLDVSIELQTAYLTLQEIADQSGVTVSYVYDLMRREKLSRPVDYTQVSRARMAHRISETTNQNDAAVSPSNEAEIQRLFAGCSFSSFSLPSDFHGEAS